MEHTQIYIDATSIGSLGVAAACVVAFANTARTVARVNGVHAAFAASLALAALRLALQWPPQHITAEILLTLFNACILFCTATGMNEFGARTRRARVKPMMPAPDRAAGFLQSWFA